MSVAAETASAAVAKATAKASPAVENTCPPWAAHAPRMMSSCNARLAAIPAESASHSLVDPSTSVKRNETIPLGMATVTVRLPTAQVRLPTGEH